MIRIASQTVKFKVMAIGDIVGRPGRQVVKRLLTEFVKQQQVNFVVANGENASGGSGITPKEAEELFGYGINVITTGDHVWSKKELVPYISAKPILLRPANLPIENPGKGYYIFEAQYGVKVGVIHVCGRVFMHGIHLDCPFKSAMDLAKEIKKETNVIIVDMHGEATSEKIAFGWHLDGSVSLIFGTHTHIQTADERILPKGTAYITDIGMTGPYESVIGRRIEPVLHRFLTQMPAAFDVAENDPRLCACTAVIDTDTGNALEIKRYMLSAA